MVGVYFGAFVIPLSALGSPVVIVFQDALIDFWCVYCFVRVHRDVSFLGVQQLVPCVVCSGPLSSYVWVASPFCLGISYHFSGLPRVPSFFMGCPLVRSLVFCGIP